VLENLIANRPEDFKFRGVATGSLLERGAKVGVLNPFSLGYALSRSIQEAASDKAGLAFYLGDEDGEVKKVAIPKARARQLAPVQEWVSRTNGLIASLEQKDPSKSPPTTATNPKADHDAEAQAARKTLEGLVQSLEIARDLPENASLLEVIRENGERAWSAVQKALDEGGTRFRPESLESYLAEVKSKAEEPLVAFVRDNFKKAPWAQQLFGRAAVSQTSTPRSNKAATFARKRTRTSDEEDTH
jgi:hypothetical protein